LEFGQLTRKLGERLGPEKHLIRIANHSRPSEIANAVHNFHRTGTAVRQIAAVQNQVGCGLSQIRQDRLKGSSIAVYVGDDCDAHVLWPVALVLRPLDFFLFRSNPSLTVGASIRAPSVSEWVCASTESCGHGT
jgi:hypothetical protein